MKETNQTKPSNIEINAKKEKWTQINKILLNSWPQHFSGQRQWSQRGSANQNESNRRGITEQNRTAASVVTLLWRTNSNSRSLHFAVTSDSNEFGDSGWSLTETTALCQAHQEGNIELPPEATAFSRNYHRDSHLKPDNALLKLPCNLPRQVDE